jgi:hypothetical protein
MKKGSPPAHFGRSGAGFSVLGFWQANRVSLLLAAAVVAAIVVLILWFSRRRRHDDFPEIKTGVPAAADDKGMTQIEDQSAPASAVSASSGIYGKIEVVVGSQQISTYLVTDTPLPIGRDPSQSLVIVQESIVSKLHCQIFARAGKVFVKDLHSTNGVYVNDEKIVERELHDQDVVFLGKKGTVKIIYHL